MTYEYCVHEAGFVLILTDSIQTNNMSKLWYAALQYYPKLHVTCSTSDKRKIREMIKMEM